MRRFKLRLASAVVSILGLSFLITVSNAQVSQYKIYRKSQWEKWSFPGGVIDLRDDGSVGLVYFRGRADSVNACLNAHEFKHFNAQKDSTYGGIKAVGSNEKDAKKIIDGRADTWWKPNFKDDLKKWWIEVDLGRAVSATKIRLIFPDTVYTAGGDTVRARPPEQFRVYYSNGIRPVTSADMFAYELAGKTTKPNTQRVVEYDLSYERADTSMGGRWIKRRLDFQEVHYVRVVLDAKTKDAALAELEVYTIGDNIALKTFERGGSIDAHTHIDKAPFLFDGELGTYWQYPILTDLEWNTWPGNWQPWFVWDLGTLFWVDEIVHISGGPTLNPYRRSYNAYPQGYILKTSDGSRTPDGKLDFQDLVDVYNLDLPHQYNFDHQFEPRKVRYIFFRHAHGTGNVRSRANQGALMLEMQVYARGYPAEVTLVSDYIDLGRTKNIIAIQWDADTPPGTRIELYSQSGDKMMEKKHYFLKPHREVSEEEYYKKPKMLRAGIETEIVPDPSSWSDWSRPYHFSGEQFLSPSPRRYVRLKVKLSSNNPELAPTLHSISILYTDPLLKAIKAQVEPRVAPADLPQRFTYRLWPTYTYGNSGFDRVWIKTPSPVDSVQVKVKGIPIVPDSIGIKKDTLFVQLPKVVRSDSVDIQFVCRVRENKTPFGAFIGYSRRPKILQRVDPVREKATIVSVPSLPESSDLIRNLVIQPRIITPNNDDSNEEVKISFSVVKVNKPAKVVIYNLRGEVIKELTNQSASENEYSWDGRDKTGKQVPPGVYICQIQVDAESGNKTILKTIGVSY